MGPTLKKCPEMSQLMLDNGEPGQNRNAENERLRKLLDLGDFQQTNSEGFSSVLDTKGAVYRRINVYSKSTEQYWKERNRRKKVWQLSGEGFTYKQIAEKLGVNEKTVQRDINKVRPYYIGRIRRALRIMEEERDRKFKEELEGKNLFQQLSILTQRVTRYKKLMQVRKYLRHTMFVTFDLDAAAKGEPPISFKPTPPFSYTKPFQIHFRMKINGKMVSLAELKIGN